MKPVRRIPYHQRTMHDAVGIFLAALVIWIIHCLLHSLSQ
jgi:hypothetical protein